MARDMYGSARRYARLHSRTARVAPPLDRPAPARDRSSAVPRLGRSIAVLSRLHAARPDCGSGGAVARPADVDAAGVNIRADPGAATESGTGADRGRDAEPAAEPDR